MRVTIIADDNAVYVDGEAITVDLTGIDPDIHAVQFDADAGIGEIEYKYHFVENTKRPNERFTDFSRFRVFVDRRTVVVQKIEAAAAAAPPAAPPGGPMNVIAD